MRLGETGLDGGDLPGGLTALGRRGETALSLPCDDTGSTRWDPVGAPSADTDPLASLCF